jgi:hypothetical protein
MTMTESQKVSKICDMINELKEKSNNIIEIINMIDFHQCVEDSEIVGYVSEYFNNMLRVEKHKESVILTKVRSKLVTMY